MSGTNFGRSTLSTRIPLTLACGDYEIIRPLKEGTVKPDGIDLTILTAMDSTTRHWRFLRGQEFDCAEVSCSSYIVARDQGLAATAIPVFLHRRFRHGFVFINTRKGITKPTDLIGKRVGVKQFQATAIVWMRGILEQEYGVPQKSIEWVPELDETIEFTPPPGLNISKLADNETVEGQLVEGKLDALIHPDLIKPLVQKDPRVGRLFPNYKQDEIAYWKKTGIFPIMHVLGIKQEIVDRHPWVPINLYHAFNQAKAIAMKRMENPRIVPLVWYREAWEEQEEIVGSDPWEYGRTERNLNNMNTIAGYCHEQGMSKRRFGFDDLFAPVSQGRKRGDEFRF
jgi:4,5-dihydroxyphthalate decarboxylase